MSKNLLLTISVLISNRPDTVRRCLDSVRPLLEQVPSELVLVDTGCGEQVRGIIEKYTDRIIDFPWCGDFSRARNAGLEQARGKWFLYLDDDEWFEDVSEIVDFFRYGEYRKYGQAVYAQRNYSEPDGSVYSDLLVTRVIRLEPDIRFMYRIHEMFNRLPGETKKFYTFVHHYGYVYRSKEEEHAHTVRNVSILLEELKEAPGDLKQVLQLAQEYNTIDRWDKSLEVTLDGIARAERGAASNEYFLSSLMGNEINCYIMLERYQEAIEKGESYLKHAKTDKMVKAVIAGNLGVVYTRFEEDRKCLNRVKIYWEVYQDYVADDKTFIAFATTITGSCFGMRRRSLILGHGIAAAARLGQTGLAWQWFQDVDWTAEGLIVREELLKAILEQVPVAEGEDRILYTRMCDAFLEQEEYAEYLVQAILGFCAARDGQKARVKALSAYEDVVSEHWVFKLARLLAADRRGRLEAEAEAGGAEGQKSGAAEAEARDRGAERRELSAAEAEAYAGAVWRNLDRSMSFIRKFGMLEAVEDLEGDNGAVLRGVPFYLWHRGIAGYLGEAPEEEAIWWNERLPDFFLSDDMRMMEWRAIYSLAAADREAGKLEQGRRAGNGADDGEGIERLTCSLKEYAGLQTALCERIYRPEVISQMPDVLPEEYRVAYHILDLVKLTEEKRFAEAVKAVREIKDLLPGLSNIMKQYLIWLDGRLKQQELETEQNAGEFRKLAEQIKAKVLALAADGERQEALGVAVQLQALVPGDQEIQKLIERLS